MGMLFNLNMRGSGGYVMKDTTISRKTVGGISTGYPLSQMRDHEAVGNKTGAISVTQTIDIEMDDVSFRDSEEPLCHLSNLT